MHYTEEMILFARGWFVSGYFVAWLIFGVMCLVRVLLHQWWRRRSSA